MRTLIPRGKSSWSISMGVSAFFTVGCLHDNFLSIALNKVCQLIGIFLIHVTRVTKLSFLITF